MFKPEYTWSSSYSLCQWSSCAFRELVTFKHSTTWLSEPGSPERAIHRFMQHLNVSVHAEMMYQIQPQTWFDGAAFAKLFFMVGYDACTRECLVHQKPRAQDKYGVFRPLLVYATLDTSFCTITAKLHCTKSNMRLPGRYSLWEHCWYVRYQETIVTPLWLWVLAQPKFE